MEKKVIKDENYYKSFKVEKESTKKTGESAIYQKSVFKDCVKHSDFSAKRNQIRRESEFYLLKIVTTKGNEKAIDNFNAWRVQSGYYLKPLSNDAKDFAQLKKGSAREQLVLQAFAYLKNQE